MDMSVKLNRNSKIMIAMLALLLVWSFHERAQLKARKARIEAERAAAATSAPALPAGVAGAAPVTEASLASLKVAPWGQDPYFKVQAAVPVDKPAHAPRRQRSERPADPDLKLHGILFAGDRSTAQIGDRVASIGEEIDGWKIVNIRPTTVTLVRRGVTITLQLHEEQS